MPEKERQNHRSPFRARNCRCYTPPRFDPDTLIPENIPHIGIPQLWKGFVDKHVGYLL